MMLLRSLITLCLPVALAAEIYNCNELTPELMQGLIQELTEGQRDELCVRVDAGTALPLSLEAAGILSAEARGSVCAHETLYIRFDQDGMSFAREEGAWLSFTELFTGNFGVALAGEESGVQLNLELETR